VISNLRRYAPTILLLAGIAATTAAAVKVYRSNRAQRQVLARVLGEYAEFASWSYEQHLEELMRNAAREVLGPVNHGSGVHVSPNIPHAAELGHFLPMDESCDCHVPENGPIPEVLLGFELGSDSVGVGPNRNADANDGWLVDLDPTGPTPPPPAMEFGDRYAWVNDTLTTLVRRRMESETGFPYILHFIDGKPSLLSYTVMPTQWGDTLIYATLYSPRSVLGVLTRVLDGENLLPPALTRRFNNRDVLNIEITTADGKFVFRSDTLIENWKLDSRVSLPQDYGSMRVRTQIRPAVASALVIGGGPRSQMPLLIGLLALATALTLVAVGQLTKQDQLARERTDFVASVSHELRTPLAQLRLFLETIRLGRADTPEAQAWSLDQMDRETRRLVHLVDNVLVFSSGPERLLEAPRARLDLAMEVDAVAAEFAPLAAARRVIIETTAAPGIEVEVSRDALRHVLLNLLDNAVKYGPQGQTVRIRVRTDAEGARIEVIDQGPGVPEAERHRIWQPFYRGSNAAARAAGGTGIGLHLVRELVTGLGGHVNVTTAGDVGACFVVHLPLTPSTARTS
jgi:signal transduction histidine kinase